MSNYEGDPSKDLTPTISSKDGNIDLPPAIPSRDVFIDKLPPGITIKHIRTLARNFGNVRTSFQFGQGEDRTHVLTFDRDTIAEKFIRSNPSVGGTAVSVSFYVNTRSDKAELYFDCENDLAINADSLTLIFELLDYVELIKTSMVCKMWYNMAMYVIQTRPQLSFIPTFSFFRLNRQLTDDNFVNILKKTNLTSLDLSNSSMTFSDDVAEAIINHCPNLAKLSLSRVIFKKKRLAMTFFASIPNIIFLDLKENDSITEKILQTVLVNCRSLEYLNVSESLRIWGKCFRCLPPSLKHLNLSFSVCGKSEGCNEIIQNVSKLCPNIETLDLSDLCYIVPSQYNVEAFSRIKIMSSLKSLKLSNSGQNLGGFVPGFSLLLTKTPFLEVLDLFGTVLSVELCQSFEKSCPSLKALNVSFCKVLNISILFRSIANLNLTHLLCDHLVPEEKREDIDEIELAIDIILGFKQLVGLEVSGFDLGNKHVAKLITHLPELKRLKIKDCHHVSDDLMTMLQDDSQFKLRTQVLNIYVPGTGIKDSFHTLNKITIEHGFEPHQGEGVDFYEDVENLFDLDLLDDIYNENDDDFNEGHDDYNDDFGDHDAEFVNYDDYGPEDDEGGEEIW